MRPKTVMIVAGDPSGDANAAKLVTAFSASLVRLQPGSPTIPPRFIGAGGPKMAEAGVELSFNLTDDAVIGPTDVLAKLGLFWRRYRELVALAIRTQPELIILVDFYTFNQRLAHAIKQHTRKQANQPGIWQPKIVQYTSPQVWGSRPWRAKKLARDIDLLLCLFPFEKAWYAQRGTPLQVEYVGHPMLDTPPLHPALSAGDPVVLLLPGSRRGELKRHLPLMLNAARAIAVRQQVRFILVAPDQTLAGYARSFLLPGLPKIEIQVGLLNEALAAATLAIASTGTVTLECAYYSLPTIALYKTSAITAQLARWLITVKYLAMPNLLAGEPVFPEFIQEQATAENIARSAIDLLENPNRRTEIRLKLAQAIATLGGPGSIHRASAAILQLMSSA